jgi:hypothetical protein
LKGYIFIPSEIAGGSPLHGAYDPEELELLLDGLPDPEELEEELLLPELDELDELAAGGFDFVASTAL